MGAGTAEGIPKKAPMEVEEPCLRVRPQCQPCGMLGRMDLQTDRQGQGWWERRLGAGGAELCAKDPNLGPPNGVSQGQRKIDPEMTKTGLVNGGDGGGSE